MDGDIETDSTRAFAAESFTFVVRSEDRELRDAVDAVFSDLPTGAEPPDEFSIVRLSGGFRLIGPEPWITDEGHRDADTIVNDLVTAVNRKRLDAGDGRLHLHAGLVANDRAAVLIAGVSGIGKSTLVVRLALDGWTYLTDEASSIALGDPLVRAFPKPVTVKQPGTEFFPELADHRVTVDDSIDHWIWNVPLGRLGVSTAEAAEPTLVVLLSRTGNPTPSWEPIRPADVVVALVEQTLDFERYGDDALLTIAELCARRRCVHVDAGTPAATASLIEELAAGDNAADLAVARLELTPRSTLVDPDVTGVAIGDEAVLRHRDSGQVISLNPAAAELWRQLADPDVDPADLGQADARFVRQLAGLGFIRMPDDMVAPRGE